MNNKNLILKKQTLVNIADAIRAKTGSAELIAIEDLDDAVANLHIGEGGNGGGIIDVEELPGYGPIPATDIEWDLDNDWELIVNGDIVGCDGIYVKNLSNEEITQIAKTLVVDENSKYGDMAIAEYGIWSGMLDENNKIIEPNIGDPYFNLHCWNEWDWDENGEPTISDRYGIELGWGIVNGNYYYYEWDNNNGWYGEYWSYSEESGDTMEWWTNEAPSYIDIKVPVLIGEFRWDYNDLYDQYGSISANEILAPLFYCKTSNGIQQDSIYRLPDGTMWMFVDDAWIQLGALDYQLKELNVTKNGEYTPEDGTYYSKINVEVHYPSKELNVIANGEYTPAEGTYYSKVNVAVPEVSGGIVDVEELPKSYLCISVPNSGYVEKIYFDTGLSIEQVVAELEKLTYDEYGTYPLLINDNIMLLVMVNNGIYIIVDDEGGVLYFASAETEFCSAGWNSDFNGEIEINAEVINEAGDMLVGSENDKIANLFYLDKQPNPDFNNKTIYRLPDKTSWILKNGEWNEIKIVDDGIIKVNYLPEKLIHGHDIVPNSGLAPYKRIMLNTSLTDAEVLKELQKLSYVKYDDQWSYSVLYYVDLAEVGRPDQYHMLSAVKIQKQSGVVYGIVDDYYVSYAPQNTWYWQNGDPWNEGNEYAQFIGWNPNGYWVEDVNNNYSPMVGCVLLGSDDYPATFYETTNTMGITMNVGLENEKITDLLYMETDETYPNPDYDPEATYKLPDGTYWINQNDRWFQYLSYLEEYFKEKQKNTPCITPTNIEFHQNIINSDNIENIGSNKTGNAPYFNASEVNDMSYMFCGASGMEYCPSYDMSSVNNTSYMFYGCSSLKEVPNLDTLKARDMQSMFYNCLSLKEIPAFDTSFTYYASDMFRNCKGVTSVHPIDITNISDLSGMFAGCESLTTIPELNISRTNSVKRYVSNMFKGCTGLTGSINFNVPLIYNATSLFEDCSNITEVHFPTNTSTRYCNRMFYNCTSLESVSGLKIYDATKDYNLQHDDDMFYNCTSLKNLDVSSIEDHFSVEYCDQLTIDSLVNLCRQCIRPKTINYTCYLYVGSANKAKLSEIYVKFVDPSVTTISSNSTGKDIEICESTAEGAMTIDSYMSLKKWVVGTNS